MQGPRVLMHARSLLLCITKICDWQGQRRASLAVTCSCCRLVHLGDRGCRHRICALVVEQSICALSTSLMFLVQYCFTPLVYLNVKFVVLCAL
jgi:hypothetical protein